MCAVAHHRIRKKIHYTSKSFACLNLRANHTHFHQSLANVRQKYTNAETIQMYSIVS